MNVVIFGGFLGSGKTSLLMQLAQCISAGSLNRQAEAASPSIVIIENEIGEVALDGNFLATGGYEVRNLFAGCICCTLTGNLIECLDAIVEQERPDWLLVEATGLAYPGKVAETLRQYRGIAARVLTVVDGQRWEELIETLEPLLMGQMQGADAILVNKTDALSVEQTALLSETLAKSFPSIPLISLCALEAVSPEVWKEALP